MFRSIVYGLYCAIVLLCGAVNGMEKITQIKDLSPDQRSFVIHGIITTENIGNERDACKLAQQLCIANESWVMKYVQYKKIFGMPKFVDLDMFNDMKKSFLDTETSDTDRLYILISMRSYIQMDELSSQFIKSDDEATCISIYITLYRDLMSRT